MMQFVGMCHDAGAQVVVGSHTSAPFAKPGEAYQREMELLVEAGLTPMNVLQAATIENARFFGAEDRLGSIESGKAADLLIVEGDPSRDIKVMNRVRYVMLNGNWVGASPAANPNPNPNR
jgi:imidazolonepropionase-like amidohydrolase